MAVATIPMMALSMRAIKARSWIQPFQVSGKSIRIVARGDALLSPTITRRLVEEFVRRPRPDDIPSELVELSERELEVMRLVARGLSNAEIAGQLYLSEATVKTHVAHILQKLHLRDRVQVVVLAYESGLAQPGS
ncbi:MAG: response regulator transcription factor [Actinobacteria bacterium]|nr:response regulator transcription factor [Actinomycetota bacterium]